MNESNSTCLKALKSDDSDTYFYHLDMFNDILIRSSRMPLVIKLLNQIEQYTPAQHFLISVIPTCGSLLPTARADGMRR